MKSVYRLEFISGKGKKWAKKNLVYESWQKVEREMVIAVEWRYMLDIISGMAEAGLREDYDYRIHE